MAVETISVTGTDVNSITVEDSSGITVTTVGTQGLGGPSTILGRSVTPDVTAGANDDGSLLVYDHSNTRWNTTYNFSSGTVVIPTLSGTNITAATAFLPDASDGASLGTAALEFSDLFLADGAVINFGDDQDVSLTHVADTGLLLSSTDRLQFGDSGTYIHQSADGVLDLVSDTEIELTATTIDINGNVDVSGTLTVGGALDFSEANITNVGSLALDSITGDADSDTSITFSGSNVITIAAAGSNQVTFIDGAIVPSADNDIDLGTSSVEFKDAFFDGTVTSDAFAGPLTGNASTATALETARTIGGTSFDGTANIAVALSATATALANARTIGGTSFDGTANIVPATITVADTTDTSSYVALFESATGDLAPKTDAAITYNAGTGALTATSFVGNLTGNVTGNTSGSSGSTTGNAATATALATARNIGGTSFDGTASIVPATITVADTTDSSCYISMFEAATGDQGPKTDAGITYNASTGALTATSFVGPLTGNVTGNASGTAATVTGAAQTNITSLGTLTALTVDDVAIDGKVVTMTGSSGDTAVFTAGSNGTLTIATTDAAAAAANIQITADGTAELAGTTVTLDSGGGITLDADGGTITFADGGSSLGTITSSGYTGNVVGNVTGNASGSSGSCTGNAATATALASGRTISMTGDVVWTSASFDGSGNVTGSATIQANSVALGTDTTGNYVATVAGTSNEIEVSGSGSEGAGVTIGLPDDVTIAGNLTVNGDTTTVNTATLSVEDPLIVLGKSNNSADSVDIGFYGLYDTSGSQDLYAGLFRDANDSGKFKLFKDLQAEPTTTVNTGGTGYAVGTLVANIEGNVTGNTSGTSGSTTGNAATATALATARTIGGTSFDGTANIVPATITVADTTDTSSFVALFESATGDLAPKTDAAVTYNAGTGALTATSFVGALTGNASGTAATVTGAAQSAITSLGTLTTLTVDNVIINGATIGHTSDTDLITLADGVVTVAGEVSVTTLDIGGTNVTSTAAELNLVDGITAGTVAASKAVIVDSNKDASGFRNITLTGELDAATLDVSGNVDIDGTTNLDAVDIDDAVQIDGTVTVGVNDTGYDVKFFGATSGAYMLWDESADDLKLVGAAGLTVAGDIDVDGTTNLDVVDIDGAVDMASTLGVTGVLTADAGIDVDNFNIDGTTIALSSGDMTLDAAGRIDLSADDNGEIRLFDGSSMYAQFKDDDNRLKIQGLIADADMMFVVQDDSSEVTALMFDASEAGAATFNNKVTATELDISGNVDVDGITNLDVLDVDGATQIDATVTVGVDGTGHDVKFFGDTASAYMLWDQSRDDLILGGAAQLGIGTATPGHPLHISEAADGTKIQLTRGGISEHAISIGNSPVLTGVGAGGLEIISLNGGAAADFAVGKTGGNEPLLHLVNTGYAHFLGAADVRVTLGTQGTAGTNDSNWIRGNGTALSYNSASGDHIWEVGGSEKMRLDSSGNVGIGEASPDSPLHVKGASGTQLKVDVDSGGRFAQVDFEQAGTQKAAIWADNTTSLLGIYAISGWGMNFYTNAGETMRITSGGLVGIGAAPNHSTLEVTGDKTTSNNLQLTLRGATNTNKQLIMGFDTTADKSYITSQIAGSAEKPLVINSSAVGIGASGPGAALHVAHSSSTAYDDDAECIESAIIQNTNGSDGSGVNNYACLGFAVADGATSQGFINYKRTGDNTGQFSIIQRTGATTYVETVTFASENTTFFNAYDADVSNGGFVYIGTSASVTVGTNSALSRDVHSFRNPNGEIGTINLQGTTCLFSNLSDYRKKENVSYTYDATSRLKQLKPCRFNWIADETNTAQDGFLAHEVSASCPEAVTGEKDGVYAETTDTVSAGDPKYQMLDASKLIPMMVKTIQELEARIAVLESSS